MATLSECNSYGCPISTEDESDYCILHSETTQKDESLFKLSLAEYIAKRDYNFLEIRFPSFSSYRWKTNDIVEFTDCKFYGKFSFAGLKFEKSFYLINCTFEGPVTFDATNFLGKVVIQGCEFSGTVKFTHSNFAAHTIISFTNFNLGANFFKTKYGPDFEFHSCFLGTSFFYYSDISKITFNACSWNRGGILAEEQYSLILTLADFIYGARKSYINLVMSWALEHLKLLRKPLGFLFKIINRSEYERQMKMRTYYFGFDLIHTGWNDLLMAEETYRALRVNHTKSGDTENASIFFYREKTVQRKRRSHFVRIFQFWVSEWLFGFGEKVGRIILNSAIVIFTCTIVYNWKGILTNNNELVYSFEKSFYFSLVTFTTLGFGDYHPTQGIQLIAALEALLGAILMALFVVTLTRKLLR